MRQTRTVKAYHHSGCAFTLLPQLPFGVKSSIVPILGQTSEILGVQPYIIPTLLDNRYYYLLIRDNIVKQAMLCTEEEEGGIIGGKV